MDFTNFNNYVKGSFLGGKDEALLLSQKLKESYDESQYLYEILNDFLGYIINKTKLVRAATSFGVYRVYCDSLTNFMRWYDQQLIDQEDLVLESQSGMLTMKYVSGDSSYQEYALYCGSKLVFDDYRVYKSGYSDSIKVDAHGRAQFDLNISTVVWSCVLSSGTQQLNIQQFVEEVAKGRGLSFAFADICEVASTSVNHQDVDPSSVIRDAVVGYGILPDSVKSGLCQAANYGPQGIVDYVCQFFNSLKDSADRQASQGNSLFSSTSVELNTFSAGAVLGTIGSLVTTLAPIVVACSRLAGIVLAITGIGLSLISKIVSVVFGEYDATRFKINDAFNANHCYTFVINQGQVVNATFAAQMRQLGTVCATFYSKTSPVVLFLYLVNPAVSSDSTIGYELHLTCDYDISSCFVSQHMASWNNGSGVDIVNFYDTQAQPGLQFPWAMTHVYGDSAQQTPEEVVLFDYHPYNALPLDPEEVMNRCFKPMSLSLFSSVAATLSDTAHKALKLRLVSALALFGYKFLYPIMATCAQRTDDTDSINERRCLRVYGTFSSQSYPYVRLFCRCLTYAYAGAMSNWDLPDITIDNILQDIKTWFDGIPLHTDDQSLISFTLAPGIQDFFQMYKRDFVTRNWISEYSIQACDLVTAANMIRMFSEAFYTDDALRAVIPNWNTSFGISLPTLTWTGYIAGLVIDGLIIMASAAVAVAGAVVSYKIKNRRAQMQAKAEAAWYTYQDSQSNAAWKSYKAARFKYNVMAWATGGTTLSLGLYDDDSATGVVSVLREFFSSSQTVHGDVVSLEDIKKVITGS